MVAVVERFTVVPAPPDYIAANPLAEDRWHWVWQQVNRTRVKPDLHTDIVAMYCQAHAQMRFAAMDIAKHGNTIDKVETKTDGTVITRKVANPNCLVYQDCIKQLAELAKMIGLRPDAPMRSFVTPYNPLIVDNPFESDADEYGDDSISGEGETTQGRSTVLDC